MAIPRKQYLANALTQSKPWEALGMSRATWYRKRQTKNQSLGVGKKKKVSYRSYPRSWIVTLEQYAATWRYHVNSIWPMH